MARPTSLSGFPEWLPEGRLVELGVLDVIRQVFELHGFTPLETRSVEPVDVLLSKGEIDKEVYAVRRLQADSDDGDALALHFDLTVPFARYVVEHSGQLDFPFRRYQIQKVWRGERPQEGRFREFTQADIDIVDKDRLAAHHDAEMAIVMAEVFANLPALPRATIHVNNRKVLEGFYRGLGIADTATVLRAIDKLDKIGPAKVRELLMDGGLPEGVVDQVLALAAIRGSGREAAERVRGLGVADPLLEEGLEELVAVVDASDRVRPGAVVADLHIARGLDYYTGTVYETSLEGYESFGSICSGGRYDALASDGRTAYPGVGISLGVTRLVSLLLGRNLVRSTRKVNSAVLVAVVDEDSRQRSDDVAQALRSRGIPCEVAPKAEKFGKQIKYADRRGIPFVWFPAEEGDTVKDIRSGDQVGADADVWSPPDTDLWPLLAAAHDDKGAT
ncbi:MAG: histidine--tRNA ligase [Candidatus Nanopelagicales bacterium]